MDSVKKLEDDAGAAGPEGHADGDLAGAGHPAGEEHVGDVGAGDEQDERNDSHEDFEREGVGVTEMGDAVGHGGECNGSKLDVVELLLGGVGSGEVVAEDLLEEEVDGRGFEWRWFQWRRCSV